MSAEDQDPAAPGPATGTADDDVVETPRPADFAPLNDRSGGSVKEASLDLILGIPVTLSMEIGRTRISIQELLQLNPGSVVELDRAVGEPMEVLVNGHLVAHGEVVVVNDRFGIQLTDVVSPSERVKRLK